MSTFRCLFLNILVRKHLEKSIERKCYLKNVKETVQAHLHKFLQSHPLWYLYGINFLTLNKIKLWLNVTLIELVMNKMNIFGLFIHTWNDGDKYEIFFWVMSSLYEIPETELLGNNIHRLLILRYMGIPNKINFNCWLQHFEITCLYWKFSVPEDNFLIFDFFRI